ncbi:MAG: hypothetical protein U1F43_35855 [Myxococcota bacterium]
MTALLVVQAQAAAVALGERQPARATDAFLDGGDGGARRLLHAPRPQEAAGVGAQRGQRTAGADAGEGRRGRDLEVLAEVERARHGVGPLRLTERREGLDVGDGEPVPLEVGRGQVALEELGHERARRARRRERDGRGHAEGALAAAALLGQRVEQHVAAERQAHHGAERGGERLRIAVAAQRHQQRQPARVAEVAHQPGDLAHGVGGQRRAARIDERREQAEAGGHVGAGQAQAPRQALGRRPVHLGRDGLEGGRALFEREHLEQALERREPRPLRQSRVAHLAQEVDQVVVARAPGLGGGRARQRVQHVAGALVAGPPEGRAHRAQRVVAGDARQRLDERAARRRGDALGQPGHGLDQRRQRRRPDPGPGLEAHLAVHQVDAAHRQVGQPGAHGRVEQAEDGDVGIGEPHQLVEDGVAGKAPAGIAQRVRRRRHHQARPAVRAGDAHRGRPRRRRHHLEAHRRAGDHAGPGPRAPRVGQQVARRHQLAAGRPQPVVGGAHGAPSFAAASPSESPPARSPSARLSAPGLALTPWRSRMAAMARAAAALSSPERKKPEVSGRSRSSAPRSPSRASASAAASGTPP